MHLYSLSEASVQARYGLLKLHPPPPHSLRSGDLVEDDLALLTLHRLWNLRLRLSGVVILVDIVPLILYLNGQ